MDEKIDYQAVMNKAMAHLMSSQTVMTCAEYLYPASLCEFPESTEEEIAKFKEGQEAKRLRHEALLSSAFAKLTQDEIDALEDHYSAEFY